MIKEDYEVKINTKQELEKFRFWYLNEFQIDIKDHSRLAQYLGYKNNTPKGIRYLILEFDGFNFTLKKFHVIQASERERQHKGLISLNWFQELYEKKLTESQLEINKIKVNQLADAKYTADIGFNTIDYSILGA